MEFNLLKKIVTIPSIYPQESALADFLLQALKKKGFLVQKQQVAENRYNLFVTIDGRGSQAILFYGHLDTVPVVEPDLWRTDPFTPTLNGGRLYGLGSYDMKGGIAAFIDAVSRSNRYAKVFLAVDEEQISLGSWEAVTHEKTFFDDVELIISAEPSFEHGLHGITTARTGRVIFTLQPTGKTAHIAHYQQGVDAIEILANDIASIYEQRSTIGKDDNTVIQVRKVEGESVGMSVCAEALAEIEVLLGASDSIEEVQESLGDLVRSNIKLQPRQTPYLPGYQFDAFPYQDTLRSIIQKCTGREMRLVSRSSVGDDNVLATLGIPVITWGPEGGNAHQANEYVELESLEKLNSMYVNFLEATIC